MTLSLRKKIIEWAILSRLAIILMQIFFNLLIPDHEPDIFYSPQTPDDYSALDFVVSLLFNGFQHWDAQYFIHIAKFGYSYENSLVFFPLFPLLMKTVANTILFPLQYFVGYQNVLLVSGVIINFVCFLIIVDVLYELSRLVLQDEMHAYRATLLFCINPASIFFSAVYSESLFALLTFMGMLYLEKKNYFLSAFCFALGGATRSNGIIACGFVLYSVMKDIFLSKTFNYPLESKFKLVFGFPLEILKYCMKSAICILLIFSPFFAHQFYSYLLFCTGYKKNFAEEVITFGRERGYRMNSDPKPDWCLHSPPLSYSHIQAKYWNVGFLEYYEWIQIPNFLLAIPMIFLIIYQTVIYVKNKRFYCLRLGFVKPIVSTKVADKELDIGPFSTRTFVYVAHSFSLLTFGILFINIQVLTRMMCSSSPVVYWFASSLLSSSEPFPANLKSTGESYRAVIASRLESGANLTSFGTNILFDQIYQWDHITIKSSFVLAYFLSFTIVGTAMFVNQFPFT